MCRVASRLSPKSRYPVWKLTLTHRCDNCRPYTTYVYEHGSVNGGGDAQTFTATRGDVGVRR